MEKLEECKSERKLFQIFNDAYNTYEELETVTLESNRKKYQDMVKECTNLFEEATRLVSSLEMFSCNENIDEVTTEDIKYFLLPYFLGQLCNKSLPQEREEYLNMAQVYFRDFIERCQNYKIRPSKDQNTDDINTKSNQKSGNLVEMALRRNAKIESYRQTKELKEELDMLKIAMKNEHVDEEIKRNFYIKLIKLSILNAKDELESIEQELQILAYKKVAVKEKKKLENNIPKQKFKPVIITRDNIQKAVFGMGYPSLPVMTVNDFYEQRVRDGIFPNQEQVEVMNKQAMAKMNVENESELKEEEEKEQNEILVDNDNEEFLARQRAIDEYKDSVRRGDGNRYNRS